MVPYVLVVVVGAGIAFLLYCTAYGVSGMNSGPAGGALLLSGPLADVSEVKFGGVTAVNLIATDKKITVKVPLGASSGTITVTSPGGTAT